MSLMEKWNETTFPIKILNYHAPGHITQKFVCNILTNAPHTCESTSARLPPVDVNVRSSSAGIYSKIALQFYRNHLLPKTSNRWEIIEELQTYLDRKVGLLYRQLPFEYCPPKDELEMLLNISLALEREIMPDWYLSPGEEKAHRDSFWRIANQKKEFCSVDMNAIFENKTSWDDILGYLAERAA